MSQNDFSLDNQSGAAFRADLNNALQALASQSSGTTAPTTTYAYQPWYDTTTGLLKFRNSANSAWVIFGPVADSTKVESYVGGTKVFDIDSAKATFTLTGAVKMPVGTTAQRPTAAQGHIRFNTSTAQFEGYDGTNWGSIGGAGNAKLDVFSGNGSTTAFTLTADPVSKNNTIVTISGVVQAKATYSLSGTTLTFTTAPPTGSSNIEVMYNVALSAGAPSDGSVTYAKLDSGLIASPADIVAGTASKVLNSANFKAGLRGVESYTYLGSVIASASASINVTSFIISEFDAYVIEIQDLIPATDNVSLWIRTSSNNGTSWDSGASDYSHVKTGILTGSTVTFTTQALSDNACTLAAAISNGAGRSFNATIKLRNPLNSSLYTTGDFVSSHSDNTNQLLNFHGSFRRTSASAVNAFQFLMSSGNIASGVVRVYGLRKS